MNIKLTSARTTLDVECLSRSSDVSCPSREKAGHLMFDARVESWRFDTCIGRRKFDAGVEHVMSDAFIGHLTSDAWKAVMYHVYRAKRQAIWFLTHASGLGGSTRASDVGHMTQASNMWCLTRVSDIWRLTREKLFWRLKSHRSPKYHIEPGSSQRTRISEVNSLLARKHEPRRMSDVCHGRRTYHAYRAKRQAIWCLTHASNQQERHQERKIMGQGSNLGKKLE